MALNEVFATEEQVLLLVGESAVVERRLRETGRVRVSLKTEVTAGLVEETLHADTVDERRVPIGRTLAEGEVPQPRRGDKGAWIIPVVEEVRAVERRLVLREEIHLITHRTGVVTRQEVPLRRQVASIERIVNEPEANQSLERRTSQP